MGHMSFKRHGLPIGDDEISVLVASEGDQPKAVFMSYDAFLEMAATLYTAIETLKIAGVDPDLLGEDDDAALAQVVALDRVRRAV